MFAQALPVHASGQLLPRAPKALSVASVHSQCISSQKAHTARAPFCQAVSGVAPTESGRAPGHVNGANGSNGHATASSSAPAQTYLQKIQETTAFIRSRCPIDPEFVMVLGSGLGVIADDLDDQVVIPYADIPHFHAPGVQGHAGRLVMGKIRGVPVMVLQGRFHYYEGHPMEEVIFPIRVAKALGAHSALLTNAAGGINHNFHLGDLMLLNDHLNLMTTNPLIGPNPKELGGPRFLDLSEAYDREYMTIIKRLSDEQGVASCIQTGVYAAVSGPTYETPAETRMLRTLGADAVGMSTVPEVIAARHGGLRVMGVSVITNLACGISHDGIGVAPVTHDEVMENVMLGTEKLRRLLSAAVPVMSKAVQRQQKQVQKH